MIHLHQELDAGPEDVVEVTLDGHANVLLLNPDNYDRYRQGEHYRYHGGLARTSPVRLVPPREGHWHIVVDLGGYPGHVRAGVQLLQGADTTR